MVCKNCTIIIWNKLNTVYISVRLKIGIQGDLNSSRVCQKCLSGGVHEVWVPGVCLQSRHVPGFSLTHSYQAYQQDQRLFVYPFLSLSLSHAQILNHCCNKPDKNKGYQELAQPFLHTSLFLNTPKASLCDMKNTRTKWYFGCLITTEKISIFSWVSSWNLKPGLSKHF